MTRRPLYPTTRVRRWIRRRVKEVVQALGDSEETRPVFIVGCQRSGTDMLMEVFARSHETRTFNESEDNELFSGFRLRSASQIRAVVEQQAASVVVFKPICDSQYTDHLLDEFPTARAIWMFRDFRDVADSAVRKWGDHQLEVIKSIQAGRMNAVGWRGERLSAETLSQLRRFDPSNLTPWDGAALFWFMRNRLFFELGLSETQRTYLVKYEDLVMAPEKWARRIFSYTGLSFWSRCINHIDRASLTEEKSIEFRPSVEKLCVEMSDRLESALTVGRD